MPGRLSLLSWEFPTNYPLPRPSYPGFLFIHRGRTRSPARTIVSLDNTITGGVGFVTSLSLMAKFDRGRLVYLDWYDLTCNDCGGRQSPVCINGTSCAIPPINCTCAGLLGQAPEAPDVSVNTTTSNCSYAKNFTFCSTSVSLAFEGVDSVDKAMQSGVQVRKLNNYSILALYNKIKSKFLEQTEKYTEQFKEAWGKFGQSQSDFASAYQGEDTRATGSVQT